MPFALAHFQLLLGKFLNLQHIIPWQKNSDNFSCFWFSLERTKKKFSQVCVSVCERKIHRPTKPCYEPGQGWPSHSLIFSCFLAKSRKLTQIFPWQEASANFWCLWFSLERTKNKFLQGCVSACERKIHRPTKTYYQLQAKGALRALSFSAAS